MRSRIIKNKLCIENKCDASYEVGDSFENEASHVFLPKAANQPKA